MKHTPGPWKIQVLRPHYCAIRSPENVHIATVGGVDTYLNDDVAGNACLIAQAPKLREEVDQLLDTCASLLAAMKLAQEYTAKGQAENADGILKAALSKDYFTKGTP